MTTENIMSLEEFEAKRTRGGATPGTGVVQQWLRALLPLTPTEYPLNGRDARNAQSVIGMCWNGAGRTRVTTIKDEMGGAIKTVIVDGKLLIVWYPADSNDG